jgi:hypothetical protein
VIPEGALIHESVERKIKQDPKYRPVNMPDRYQIVPMLEDPTQPVPPPHGGAMEAVAG